MDLAPEERVNMSLDELVKLKNAAKKAAKKGKKKPAPSKAGKNRIEKLHGQMDQKARQRAYDSFCQAPADAGSVLLATDLAARGIDVQAVDWVVQYDAPLDPAAFVHRIGRTARAGQSGRSIIMLMPSEDSYPTYLQQRGITLEALPASLAALAEEPVAGLKGESSACAALKCGKRLLETDRTVMMKASKAFVSVVRAYQEHQLPFLFPFHKLDLGSLATGFCLLRMPRMKEILGKKITGFKQSPIDPASVPFRSKGQEKQRQEKLKKEAEEKARQWEEEGKIWTEAEAKENEAKEKEAKKAAAEKAANKDKLRTRTQKRKATKKGKVDEWKLLQAEEGLAKKLKNGKISMAQFDKGMMKATRRHDDSEDDAGDSDDSDDSSDESQAAGKKDAKTGADEKVPSRSAKKIRILAGGKQKRRGKARGKRASKGRKK
mmetsp:Transcript_37418/g.81476  ORF Transcript_37418/g.81476 Transcript_37418/m.81476 type:complete len:434 (-) Transcript_37418:79-1380(-)